MYFLYFCITIKGQYGCGKFTALGLGAGNTLALVASDAGNIGGGFLSFGKIKNIYCVCIELLHRFIEGIVEDVSTSLQLFDGDTICLEFLTIDILRLGGILKDS